MGSAEQECGGRWGRRGESCEAWWAVGSGQWAVGSGQWVVGSKQMSSTRSAAATMACCEVDVKGKKRGWPAGELTKRARAAISPLLGLLAAHSSVDGY
jgi:hypothetical protein